MSSQRICFRFILILIPDEVNEYFNRPNSSSRSVALGSTQPLTEMSTRNISGDKWWLGLKAYNLTTIFEPID
jgi:hypothetical protein